jgi:hypothetical protein
VTKPYFALAALKYWLNNPNPNCRHSSHVFEMNHMIHTFCLRPTAVCLTMFMVCAYPYAFAQNNELDEQGRLIAAPTETDLVERGYLFYPLRVLPKKQAEAPTAALPPLAIAKAVSSDSADKLAATLPTASTSRASTELLDDAQGDANGNVPKERSAEQVAASSASDASSHTADASTKPAAASVLVQVLEPVKPATAVHADKSLAKEATNEKAANDEHANAHDAKPELSKAELAKAESAKAAEARAAKLKEEQAKSELAKAERAKAAEARAARLKEEQAKAEWVKAERAKAAQARAEKIKQEQAKAERARAERVMLAAQAKVDKALDDLAKAEKAFAMLGNPDTQAAEEANAEPTKAEPAKDEQAKAAPAKSEPTKAEPAKDEHAQRVDTPAHASVSVTAGQKILLPRAENTLLMAE